MACFTSASVSLSTARAQQRHAVFVEGTQHLAHRGEPHVRHRDRTSAKLATALRSALRRLLLVVMREKSSGSPLPAAVSVSGSVSASAVSPPSVMKTLLSALRK